MKSVGAFETGTILMLIVRFNKEFYFEQTFIDCLDDVIELRFCEHFSLALTSLAIGPKY